MRTAHLVEDPPRKAQPAFSQEELVCTGVICATVLTLLALVVLVRLTLIMG